MLELKGGVKVDWPAEEEDEGDYNTADSPTRKAGGSGEVDPNAKEAATPAIPSTAPFARKWSKAAKHGNSCHHTIESDTKRTESSRKDARNCWPAAMTTVTRKKGRTSKGAARV